MTVTLRPYQADALDSLDQAIDRGKHPLCKLPTGGGKSLVLAALIKKRVTGRGERAVLLTHTKELLEQDARALRRIAPEIRQSFYSAGMREKRGDTDAVFASVQTLYRNPSALGPRDLLLIDEAHLCPRDSDAMYASVFEHFGQAQPGGGAVRVGFTATDQRLDSGKLTEGEGAWFDHMAYSIPVGDLIRAGYLVPLSGVLTELQAQMDGVDTGANGDFVASQAEAAVQRSLDLAAVVQSMLDLAKRRKHWLVFAAGIDHAAEVTAALSSAGLKVGTVTSKTPDGERDSLIDEFREGNLRALVNVGVLTTGFDAPYTDAIIVLRPTKSPVLWEQILGRGMRLADGKHDCLLLDYVGNLERLGGVGCVVEIKDQRIPGSSPIPVAKPLARPKRRPSEHDVPLQNASLMDPMKSGRSFGCAVEHMRFMVSKSYRHPGRKMLLASYDLCDDMGRALKATAYISVEYAGAARMHAEQWFARRGFVDPGRIPRDAHAALIIAETLPQPIEVLTYWDPTMKQYLILNERFA